MPNITRSNLVIHDAVAMQGWSDDIRRVRMLKTLPPLGTVIHKGLATSPAHNSAAG